MTRLGDEEGRQRGDGPSSVIDMEPKGAIGPGIYARQGVEVSDGGEGIVMRREAARRHGSYM